MKVPDYSGTFPVSPVAITVIGVEHKPVFAGGFLPVLRKIPSVKTAAHMSAPYCNFK